MSSTKRGNEFDDRGEPSKQVKVEEGTTISGDLGAKQEADKAAEAAGKSITPLSSIHTEACTKRTTPHQETSELIFETSCKGSRKVETDQIYRACYSRYT